MAKEVSRVWVWRFDGHPPAAIWQTMADTARFNEAARLPKQEIEELAQPDGSVRYFARARKGPFTLAWQERPVNWVFEHWFEHCRDFTSGPLKSLCATLTMVPTETGCDGRYRVDVVPANFMGRLILASGQFFRSIEKTFTPLADAARDYAAGAREAPFDHPPPQLPRGAAQRVAAMVARLEATPPGHSLARRLADLILTGSEVDMWHIRPLLLARRWDVAERQVIELCLQAVKEGLLELRWDLLCPRCRVGKASADGLDRLPDGAHCSTCNIDYDREFSRNVEATFRPPPAVRPIAGGEYCLFGPMSTPHIKVHVTLDPGTSRELEAGLETGPYRLRTLEPGDELDLSWSEGGFPEMRIDAEERVVAGPPAPPGTLRLVNQAARPLTFIIESREWVRDALTADRVTAMQAFRDLFSEETLRPGDEVGIGRVALMFTDLKGSTALYERVGDAAAYHLVRDHFAFLVSAVREHNGALVKTIGDAVMASFSDPGDAVRAALAVQARVPDFNREHGAQHIRIKLGLHAGPCIAVTMNDRLDYFGSTVNMAARLQGQSQGGDIVLSQDMVSDPTVSQLLSPYRLSREAADLKGFDQPVPFLRLTAEGLVERPGQAMDS
ncbi:MAG: adenylate/guanylate cyclase domain-containing protein [Kiloniellales bacterium]